MIPFSPPRIDKEILDEVMAALTSGWITTGPRTKQFEKEISDYVGVEKVLAVSSWTAGAEMLLHWFGVTTGDEVIVPAYTYCATANIIIHCGATPVMVDVKNDFCIDIDAIEKAITPRTKAILSVDIGGYPVDYLSIKNLIAKESIRNLFNPKNEKQKQLGRILFISDAAHSFGANYNNEKVGKQADFTVFSFHAVKNLTTAEGGGICLNLSQSFDNLELYQELNILSLHGQSKDALAKTQKGCWEYDVHSAGFKCNMTDILASIGLVELRRYDSEILPKRKIIVSKYSDAFSAFEWAIIPPSISKESESAYHLYLLRIKGINIEQRNDMIQYIFEKDVSVNVHYKPLPELSFYKSLGYKMNHYPVSKQLWENEISLPIFYDLTDKQINQVIEVVVEAYYSITQK